MRAVLETSWHQIRPVDARRGINLLISKENQRKLPLRLIDLLGESSFGTLPVDSCVQSHAKFSVKRS